MLDHGNGDAKPELALPIGRGTGILSGCKTHNERITIGERTKPMNDDTMRSLTAIRQRLDAIGVRL